MADTVTTKWIWPPNWDGGFDDNKGTRKWVVHLTAESDSTGESSVRKVDISTLYLPDGSTPTRSIIETIEYEKYGYTSIRLYWDRTPSETIAYLGGMGHGEIDFTKEGGNADPGASGEGTGDIMLTNADASEGDSYDIRITFRLK